MKYFCVMFSDELQTKHKMQEANSDFKMSLNAAVHYGTVL